MCADQKEALIQKTINQINEIDASINTKFYIDLVNEWLGRYDDFLILGCESNAIGHVVIAVYSKNNIYLLGERYPTIMYAPKIMFHMESEESLRIDDILTKHINVGNGSILMRALLAYASLKNIKMISGMLSSIDDDHIERRNHFYEKFGFEIKPNCIFKTL
jgi:hypothetical protein